MALESGRWEMITEQNYDAFLKAVNVAMIQRTLAAKEKPTEVLTITDDRWELTVQTALNTYKQSFVLGEPTDFEGDAGQTGTVTVSRDLDTLTEVRTTTGGQSTVVKKYTSYGMEATFTAGGVMATRVYKRL